MHVSMSQVLFNYGKNTVTQQEFLKAFYKNNTGIVPTEKAFREYMELYIRFKLKVQAAYQLKLDTLPNQKVELKNFRDQIATSYMNDDASLQMLVDEAMERAKIEIRVSHIYISKQEQPQEKLQQIKLKLQQGVPFEELAVSYSNDPEVGINRGDLGYISSLALPYEMESAVYGLSAGAVCNPIETKNGFHIFKKLDSRPAKGKIKVAQILLTVQPGISEVEEKTIAAKADSLVQLLHRGADFATLAKNYSEDNLTYQLGGVMPEFGVGHYDPQFEAAAFDLKTDGAFSKAIRTPFGYHIIKRIALTPVATDIHNESHRAEWLEAVRNNDRIALSKAKLLEKIKEQIAFKKMPFQQEAFEKFSLKILEKNERTYEGTLKPETQLFSIKNNSVKLKEWAVYLGMLRDFTPLSGGKSIETIFNEYVESRLLDYYKEHLESYQPDFAYQMKEFKEGNLLFEIMQKKIWDPAANDTVALKKYYASHKKNYTWEPSADAIIFTCSTDSIGEQLMKKLEEGQKDWRTIMEESQGTILADSGRYELGQIPVVERTAFTEGLITAPVKSLNEESVTISYIVKMYPQKSPRSYQDAKGYIINDYQLALEEQWIQSLKQKYPVKINAQVLKSLK